MVIRVLIPERDEQLFRQAWKWKESYPRLVRAWDGLKHFRQWFALMKRRVSVGVFTDRLIAIVTLRPDGNDVYEAHVDCERGVDTDVLLEALLSIEQTVFDEWQAREIFVAVISRNWAILRIAEICGFQRDGIEERVGKLRWIRLRITRDEYNSNSDRNSDQYLRASAGGEFTGYRSAA